MKWTVAIAALLLISCERCEDPVEFTWSVVVELTELSDFPTNHEIRPYRDALVAHQYRIIDWKSGENPFPEVTGIVVYHWAIIDQKPTEVADWKAGEVFDLRIQRMSDLAELKGRFRKNSLDAFDLQEYFARTARRRDKPEFDSD